MLLNRCITRAHSISDARQALQELGYEVLATVVPRLEVSAQSFGLPVPDTGRDVWRRVARELIGRCAPPCRVRSWSCGRTQAGPVRIGDHVRPGRTNSHERAGHFR